MAHGGYKESYSGIRLSWSKDILTLTLNKPRRKNAIDPDMYLEIVHAMGAAREDPAIRALILTGAGDYFTSGADLSQSDSKEYKESMRDPVTAPVGRFMLAVLHFPKILIAAVNGPAVGIGVTLLLHCDFVYAAPSATFWTPFTRVAVVPEFCSSVTFPRVFGPSVAREMLMGARLLKLEEAVAYGLVSEVIPEERLLSDVEQRLRVMLDQPLSEESLPLYKQMINAPVIKELEQVFQAEMVELGKRAVRGDTGAAIKILNRRMAEQKLKDREQPQSRL